MGDFSSQEQPNLFEPNVPSLQTGGSFQLERKFHWQYIVLNILLVLFLGLFIFLLYETVSPYFASKEVKGKIIPTLPKTAQVDILNGSGVSGIGMKLTKQLRSLGIDVIDVGNFSGDVNESFIIDRVGNRKDAVMFSLTTGLDTSKIVQQISHDYLVNLSLVLGKDYQRFFTNNSKEKE